MKKFKKIFASILAVSTMAIGMTGISANAYDMSYNYRCRYANTPVYSSAYAVSSVSGSASCTDNKESKLRLYKGSSNVGSTYTINIYSSPVSFNYSNLNNSYNYKIGVYSAYATPSNPATGHVTATGK